jgi:peroxiredoxin
MLAPNTSAPDFALPNQSRQTVRLADFRGRQQVVLAFHPLAFTPVCSVQMQTYEREKPRLDAAGAHVLGISLDAGPSKKAWADALGGLSFDLLSDFHPHGEVSRAYEVLRDDGLVERAIYVVDKAGIIRWAKLYDIPEQPDFDELLANLR